GVWRRVGRRGPGRPGRALIYRVIWRPAVAEIVGDGRPWTVLTISLLSIRRQGGGRAGRAARLDRRAGRWLREPDSRSRARLAGAAGGGRTLDPARRTHRQGGS